MELQEMKDIKVFICYAREDNAIATKLYADLERAGVSPWIDTEDLKPDQDWHVMINSVIKESSFVIALLSSHSLSKHGYVQQELKKALDVLDELPISDIFMIPARLDDCQPMDERLQNLYWVDLFPSYKAGLERILRVLVPPKRMPEATPQEAQKLPAIHLRSEPLRVSEDEAEKVLGLKRDKNGFWRPREYIQNQFEVQGEVVIDHATGLIWQKSGSDEWLTYKQAQEYVKELNYQKFAGYDNWRLPTLPELISLLEPERQSNDLYIDPIFDETQIGCWSADRRTKDESLSGSAWFVYFGPGFVACTLLNCSSNVRCVRSWQKC